MKQTDRCKLLTNKHKFKLKQLDSFITPAVRVKQLKEHHVIPKLWTADVGRNLSFSGGLLVLIINLFPCADSGIIMQQHRRQIIKHRTRKNNNSYQIKWQLANLTKQGKLLHIFFPSLMACHIWQYLCQNKPPVNATTTDYNILHFHYGKFYSSKGKNEQKLQTAKSTSRENRRVGMLQLRQQRK